MKQKFLIYLFSALSISNVRAQTTDQIIALFDRHPITVNIQDSDNGSIFIEAVKPFVSIIRQQYRLEREGKYYGKNNMPFYGETYTLAVKVPGGTFMQRSVLHPWENDADYQRVSEGGKYTHSLFWSYQRQLRDSVWKRVELDRKGSRYVKPIDNDSLIFNFKEEKPDFGLVIDKALGRKQGYMIWAYSKTNARDSAMHIGFQQEGLVINVSVDNLYHSVNPDNVDRIIGGIFVVPQVEKAGYIKLLMAGIAAKNKEGKWVLCLLGKRDENDKVDNSDKRKEKEEKKNDPEGLDSTPIY